jgi:hypothetical protein
MKNLIFCLLLGLTMFQPLSAQEAFYDFYFKLGVSPKQTPVQSGIFVNRKDPMNEFIFNLEQIKRSFSAGFGKNLRLNDSFFGTVGLEYSLHEEVYTLHYTQPRPDPGGQDYTLNTKSHMISMPVGIGVRFNKFDISSGLRLQYTAKASMHEKQPSGIELTKPSLQMGWYTGVGFSFDRTRIGVQYQASSNRYGSNLKFQGKPLELMSVPGNVSVTIGFSF